MSPGGKPTSPLEEALKAQPRLMGFVVNVARKRVRTADQAEDFAQEATMKAIVRSRKTGEPKPPPVTASMVLLFIGSILNTLTFNKRRGDKRHPHSALDEADPKHQPEAAASPEQVLGAHYEDAQLDRMETELRASLASEGKDREIPLAMFDLAAEGVEKNDDFAERIGCPVEAVERARRRIAHHGNRIRERVAAEDRPS
jgi:DNA-directed RNA polymerase specialized sigma24 family protein